MIHCENTLLVLYVMITLTQALDPHLLTALAKFVFVKLLLLLRGINHTYADKGFTKAELMNNRLNVFYVAKNLLDLTTSFVVADMNARLLTFKLFT